MDEIKKAWSDFRQLFIAAHHNPVARRRNTDDYAVECRLKTLTVINGVCDEEFV